MLTTNQIENIVESFKNEACYFLKIDASSIKVKCDSSNPNQENVSILDSEDTIVVNKQYLDKCIISKSTTSLQTEIYAKTRLIYKRRKDNQEAMLYAYAMIVVKGLNIPHHEQLNNKNFRDSIKSILNTEFGFEGDFINTNIKTNKGVDIYTFVLNDKGTKKEIDFYQRNTKSTVRGLSEEAKGSINNPFDNIYDAINYLKRIEKNGYEADELMQGIASKDYFYDPNKQQFCVSRATPYVAHLKNNYPDHSFIVNQMEPLDPTNRWDFNFSFKPNLYKHKFLYRGQSDHYPDFPCVPNLFRDKKHNQEMFFLEFLIFSQELEILIKSHPLTQLLEAGVTLLHDQFKIRMHYTGLAQHYYNRSTFLDLTSDIDVMKFFATTGYNHEKDEYFPMQDMSKTGVIYYYELLFPNAFQQHVIQQNKGYALKTIGKQVFMRSGAQSGFLLEMSQGVDFKTLPEVKAIYFKHDLKISEEIFKESNDGENYFADDILKHAWLDRMKERFQPKEGSKEPRKVSIKTVEYNVSLNEGETIESITKKLNDLGIEVDNYIPKFTDNELDIYYQSIKNGWWEEFCNDIYFHGADGDLYRDELKNIRNRDEYRWAFEKGYNVKNN